MKLSFERASTKSVGSLTALAVGTTLSAGAAVFADEVDNSGKKPVEHILTLDIGTVLAQGSDLTTVEVPDHKREWTKVDEKQFKALVVKRALKTISTEEQKQFHKLQVLRRRYGTNLSPQQVLAEHRRNRMMDDLLSFFEKYGSKSPRTYQERRGA